MIKKIFSLCMRCACIVWIAFVKNNFSVYLLFRFQQTDIYPTIPEMLRYATTWKLARTVNYLVVYFLHMLQT